MKEKSGSGLLGGWSFSEALGLIFIVLKLSGAINWRWIWVLSPLWISTGTVLVVLIVAFIAIVVKENKYVERDGNKKSRKQ